MASSINISVCVAPSASPCKILNVTMVSASALQLQAVGGILQAALAGQNFQPVSVRVIDTSNPPHPVLGATVDFLAYLGRTSGNEPIFWKDDGSISQASMPVILARSQLNVQSDANGLAAFPLSTQGISGNVAIAGTATTEVSVVQFEAQQFGP